MDSMTTFIKFSYRLRASCFLLMAIFVMTFSSLVFADDSLPPTYRVSKIVIQGNYRIDESSIRTALVTKVGNRVSQSDLRQDIKSIHRLGFFKDVQVDVEGGLDDTTVIFSVAERPAIRKIEFEGNDEFSDETLTEKLNLEAKRFLSEQKVRAGIKEVVAHYRAKGFYGTEVDFKIKKINRGEVDLTFFVKEGKEQLVRDVEFVGVKALDESDLKSVIKTSSYFWLTSWATGSGVIADQQLKIDAQLLQQHYLTKGFAEVKIPTPTVSDTKDGLKVVFVVDEGPKYSFGNIKAKGSLLDNSEKETLSGIVAKPGSQFDVSVLREDVFAITDKFTDKGYAFTNVNPLTKLNPDKRTVDVTFDVNQGDKIKINRINIVGNDKTQDNVVRRTLKINEQETYSSSKIKRSQELLRRLGFFDEVSISPQRTNNPGEVDLTVAIKEAMTGQFSAGAGVSSGDGFIVTGRISENNLMGTGNRLSLDINSGQLRQNYVLSFDNPRVDDSYLSFGADLALTQRDFEDFLRNQDGGSVTIGYPLYAFGDEFSDDVRMSLGYELMQNEISDIGTDVAQLVRDQEGKSVSSALIPGITRTTIDNPLDPQKGSRQMLRFEYAGLGGDQKYWLGQANNTWYYPLVETSFGNLVFSQRTQFGWGDAINGDNFPLFKRFFPGGINSLRGFDAREVGPKEGEDNFFGGNKQLILNFELIFPLVPSVGLNGLVFYDAGNAYDDDDGIKFAELREAIGWGIRWRSPLAPIRFEVGYPLDRETGEKSVVTNFSFGAPL